MGPSTYRTAWRMELVAHKLRVGNEPLTRIAREVGYGSDSALSVAFKRVIGVSPDNYRRSAVSDPTS
ncbi:helix-turn-helix domain-containing protein [Rhodococcus sp. AW25M09]|uniref:helix-turn-helix domain-containing protein n=1 Tax=Rhodococcus sp. AW25M09 TaxID=1268303 RepID=UPI000348785E